MSLGCVAQLYNVKSAQLHRLGTFGLLNGEIVAITDYFTPPESYTPTVVVVIVVVLKW